MKILIIRFSSIGDIVITSPVVRCTRNAYPDAEIHYLTKKQYVSLIEHNPNIDRCLSLADSLAETIEQLKKEQYDVVIDLHKNLRTRGIKRALKTRWVDYNKLNFKKWLWVNFKINRLPRYHLVHRYFEALMPLGISHDGIGLQYFFPPDFRYDLEQHDIKAGEYIAISIGGTYATKRMPAWVVSEIIKRLNRPCVLLGGGKTDEQLAQNIINLCDVDSVVINLVNRSSLHESAYLVKKAKNVITGDTGIMHIAAAFNKPVDVVWGNTHPQLGMFPYMPKYPDRIQHHEVDLPCRPCNKLGSSKCPRGHFKCMNDQNIVEIVQNCQSKK